MQKSNAAGKTEWVDPDDAPELTDEFFERAEVWHGDTFIRAGIRAGRPKSANPKQLVSVRLDPDVLAWLRSTGPGWQTRVNGLLRAAKDGQTISDPAPPATPA